MLQQYGATRADFIGRTASDFFAHDIVLTISDNGVGIKSSDTLKSNSFGLRGMRERVTALHGTFAVQQSNKQGTVITIKLPVE